MKLVTFEVTGPVGRVERLGALLDGDERGRIADLTAAFTAHLAAETREPTPREYAQLRVPPDMIGWLRAAHEGHGAADHALAYARAYPDSTGIDGEKLVYNRAEVRLLAPLPRPLSFRDFSIFEEHMTRAQTPFESEPRKEKRSKMRSWYTTPHYHKQSVTSIRGPEDPVPWPYYTELLDLELEIGIVIGKQGRNLTVEEARDYIAGYTILVDSSCRDGAEREPFGPTKRKDFHTALGPCLVTADEIDPETLACRLSVDGETWFEGSTAAPHGYTPAHLVAFFSDNETIYPGDLLGTGAIGTSCSMDTHRWVKIGQTATFAVAGIGSMALKIIPGERVVTHVKGMEGLLSPPNRP